MNDLRKNISKYIHVVANEPLSYVEATNSILDAFLQALPEEKKRIDDNDDEFGTFCVTCGLSTDKDINTGLCYCDHYNQALTEVKHILNEARNAK